MSSILTSNVYSSFQQLIKQTNENIESSFSTINNTTLHFLTNKAIRTWISGDVPNDENYYNLFINKNEMEEELKYSLLFNNAWDMKLITTAYIYLDESSYFSVSRSSQNVQIVNENNQRIFKQIQDFPSGKGIIPPPCNDETLYFTRVITNINNPDQRMILIVGTEENQIFKKYKELLDFPGTMAYIVDNSGTVFSSSDKSKLGGTLEKSLIGMIGKSGIIEVTLNHQTYFIASKKISDTGLTFIAGIPKNQVLAKLSDSIRNYLYITLVIIFALLAFSIFISLRLTLFIQGLLKNINKVKSGNYDAKMPAYNDMELNLLSETFNNMTSEIKYLINQVYEKQLILKETEFKFLQSQMNPHFLFNTLVTIGYKARLSNDETIYKMVTSLSELLQASIYTSSKEKVSIRQELEFVEFYLYLQKARFEDKLEYNIKITDEGILDYYLPKLCIEPIVENSVVHGLECKISKGTVDINISRDSDSVNFEIIDDGTGFEADNINLEDSESMVRLKKGHNSIGLKNTNKRIKLMYGEKYGIFIKSELNKGTRVSVHIPVDMEEVSHV